MIRTNITGEPEYLSESLGLWMAFLLNRKDERILKSSIKALAPLALFPSIFHDTSPFFVRNESVRSLNEAGTLWGNSEYGKTAVQIGEALEKYNTNDGY
jgi:hypothetical protein